MNVNSKTYQEHELFQKLERYIQFYDQLSDSIMPFLTMGTKALGNIDTYVFSSFRGTLGSIAATAKLGHLNDSYSLLRKFYDGIYINIYTILYLEDNINLQKFIVQEIQCWLSGTAQLPSTRTVSDYIRTHKRLADLNNLLFNDKRYADLRERCNDNAHYNYYRNLLLNDSEIYNPSREKALNELSADVSELVLIHLSWLFYLNQHYMGSTDHLDYLECGMTPPEDSQYWVASYVQEMFDELIKSNRADIAKLIIENTSMHLK